MPRYTVVLVLVVALMTACVDAYRERALGPLGGVPNLLRIEPDACTMPARGADGPLRSDASSTRLRKVNDARRDPTRVGAMLDFNQLDPIPLFQDTHAPLEIALWPRG